MTNFSPRSTSALPCTRGSALRPIRRHRSEFWFDKERVSSGRGAFRRGSGWIASHNQLSGRKDALRSNRDGGRVPI